MSEKSLDDHLIPWTEEHICQGAMCEHRICLCQNCGECDQLNALLSEDDRDRSDLE